MDHPRLRAKLSRVAIALLPVASIALFVVWAHFGSGIPTFRSQASAAPGWSEFRRAYGIDSFGTDGYFTRGVQNGYSLFYFTPGYASRFTRKSGHEAVHSCAHCHSVEDLAYALVNSDRYDAKLGKRVAFEERIMRCYVEPMDGFVPTLYDPAVRDIRLLARAVAHRLELGEGARREGG